jgi:HAD superfamily hydrolase (TIGR01509 family)
MLTVYPHVRGLIFDCDGTLVDSMPLHMEAWREAMHAVGEPFRQDFIDRLKGMPAEKIVERYNQTYDRRIDPRAFARDKNTRAHRKLANVRPIAAVVGIVKQFHGRLPMAVASGGTRRNVELALTAVGLAGSFDLILTGDDRVAPKPSPEIFLEAARRLGIDPTVCQVFEDGEMGLIAARQAGMTATDVRPYL